MDSLHNVMVRLFVGCVIVACGCSAHGSIREDCDQMAGRCKCRPGVTGQKCTVCANGKQLGPNGCTGNNTVTAQTRSSSNF